MRRCQKRAGALDVDLALSLTLRDNQRHDTARQGKAVGAGTRREASKAVAAAFTQHRDRHRDPPKSLHYKLPDFLWICAQNTVLPLLTRTFLGSRLRTAKIALYYSAEQDWQVIDSMVLYMILNDTVHVQLHAPRLLPRPVGPSNAPGHSDALDPLHVCVATIARRLHPAIRSEETKNVAQDQAYSRFVLSEKPH